MITCPSCIGNGNSEGFACGPAGGRYTTLPCSVCKGAGKVSLETASHYTLGRAMAKERQGRDMSLREEAKRLGIGVVDLSDIEHGREPRTEAGKAALEKRTEEMAAHYAATTTA